ncbi:hypothetical protein L1987_15443 [Smallanthus sonchifolius]|uniref:Uncharacterized protein n=1 Tax=Smallanthus sonchifolius TaxID=185202 RepID=A0ACB9J6M0_9ASTR|nr:hypothetical protein L1987_15443 [Smallanthus sonchifolius]
MSFTAVVVWAGLREGVDVGKQLGDGLDGGLRKDDEDGVSFTVVVVVVNIFTVEIVGSYMVTVIVRVLQ